MAPLRWLGRLIGFLWSFSKRSWIDTGVGLRPRSRSSALVLFLFLIFFLVGLVLMLLGFNLGELDAWLERHSAAIEAVAMLAFRAVAGFALLICVAMFALAIFDRRNPDRPGIGCLLVALVAGYFAWIGMTAEL